MSEPLLDEDPELGIQRKDASADRSNDRQWSDEKPSRRHRGHRLGLLVKIENVRHTLGSERDLRYIDTWNAAENTHMIAINEAIGFRAVDAWVDWQLEV